MSKEEPQPLISVKLDTKSKKPKLISQLHDAEIYIDELQATDKQLEHILKMANKSSKKLNSNLGRLISK